MLDVRLNHSLYKTSDFSGCCDVYGRRGGFGSENWKEQRNDSSESLGRYLTKEANLTEMEPDSDSENYFFKEQSYEGTFLKDSFHGEGSYKWSSRRQRQVFEGHFYSNFKEGYGLVSMADGSVFEGLFHNNKPFGPGVYTHVNGRQDVGFWSGRRIVRLSRSVDFIIPRLTCTSKGKLKLLQFQTLMPFVEENTNVAAALLSKYGLDPSKRSSLCSSLVHDPRSLFFNKIDFDRVYFVKVQDVGEDCGTTGNVRSLRCQNGESKVTEEAEDITEEEREEGLLRFHTIHKTLNGYPIKFPGEKDSKTEKEEIEKDGEEMESTESIHLISWNRSELCMEILKQIFRFRSFEGSLSYKISDLMAGERMKFRKTGEKESLSLQFLRMCSIGPAYAIKDLLCSGDISEELMDSRGNNGVMFAAASDQREIIDLLLNHGFDVNAFNDENLTPLNLCLLRRITETFSLGNWEVSFLSLDDPAFIVDDAKNRICQVNSSSESLDRIFGDGMSINSEYNYKKDKDVEDHDSVFSIEGESISQITSEITMLRYYEEKAKDREVSFLGAVVKDENTGDTGRKYRPGSFKKEEYIKSVAPPTDKDKYFFDISLENKSEIKVKTVRSRKDGFNEDESLNKEESAFNEKLNIIDKTIELLLVRGADPNLADAPKPSLHLAVYCKELSLVRLLLMYGASPDSQSLPQEGLLTPLHVVVLMKPSQEQVDMCELLLNYGASAEEETSPDFTPYKDEFLMDPEHGRTPLQLLCMRRDAEYADPDGFLGQLAYLLGRVSKKGRSFKGHSYLTLAMMSGNYAIMKALLKCKKINPNEILGKDLGTSFHVLVSTDLQKRTCYESSIRMYHMLLENDGNPNIKLGPPLGGTCVDYGYAEIERERTERQESGKTQTKDKPERDHLESHIKVVDYIASKSNWVRKDDSQDKAGSESESNDVKKKKSKAKGRIKEEVAKENLKGEDFQEDKTFEVGNNKLEDVKKNPIQNAKKENTKVNNGMKVKKEGKDSAKTPKLGEGSKSFTKIIEIKKHASIKEKLQKRSEKSPKMGRDPGKIRNQTKGEQIEKTKPKTGEMGKVWGRSKDKRSYAIRAGYSEKLPERFRQSLLHMFGLSGGFNFNDLLLPYVVLRNGDLYYRFKGQKFPRTEQYSLI